MKSQGNTDFDMKLSGHVPLLWKRKVRNLIKKDPQRALVGFFENFKQGNDIKKMSYGLEQLLPQSLQLILSSFEKLDQEETYAFFELISTPEFLQHLSSLNQDEQVLILNQIYTNWNSDLNQEPIRLILNQLDPSNIELLYTKISNESTKLSCSPSIEIIQLWGIDVYPNVLQLYLKTPINDVGSLFKKLSPKHRVQVFNTISNLSQVQFKNLLQITSPTEEEINFLFALHSSLTQKSKDLFLSWLVKQPPSQDLILCAYQKQKTEENLSFVVNYFINCTKKKIYPIPDIIISTLNFREFAIAHEILKRMDESKDQEPIEILILCLKKLQDRVAQYLDFFNSEFQTYESSKTKLLLLFYLESDYKSHHRLLLPFLKVATAKKWKMMINTIIDTKILASSNRISDIFDSSSVRIKQKIGTYIIEQSWIPQLTFLFQDFEIFRSALIYSRELSITTQVLLEPFLQHHMSENFETIVRLGKKITFPQLAFASKMDPSRLKSFLTSIGSNKELIHFWEELFLLCSKDALQVVLEDFLLKTKKTKDYLIPLLKKLIDLELQQFWIYFNKIASQDILRLEPVLIHAFDLSIPIIGDVLSHLPDKHLTFIIEHILPQFTSSGSKILYSLLTLHTEIQYEVIQRAILETIKFNPEEMLIIVLIRCSNLINNIEFSDFASNLYNNIFSLYSLASLKVVDSYKLTNLISSTKIFLSSLPAKEVENVLLTVLNILESNILNPIIVDYLVQQSRKRKGDSSLFYQLFSNYEKETYSIEGENVLRGFIQNIVGKSSDYDIFIFSTFNQKPRCQSLLLPIFFAHTSQHVIERILLDPTVKSLEKNTLKAITKHFEAHPPEKPEEYFFTLYRKVRGEEEVQRSVLPLLGEYCSWQNLSLLMELPEKDKYQKEYQKALVKFASRFDIQSPKALHQIWVSGLKDVYTRLKEPETLLQSQCPQCGNPILEKQKNCGFCSQRLTCIICRKSVVQLQIEEEVVQCPQCSSFFHRQHLLESVKIKSNCPVCNVSLRETEVDSLPVFTFFFR
ncbi:MAG: RING finger protein [Promethearchaeota archaeon]